MRKTTTRRIALVYPYAPWVVRCMDGARRYARAHGQWELVIGPQSIGGTSVASEMRGWKGHGIITLIDDECELREVRKMGIATVNLGSWLATSFGIPRVMVNHYKGGRLAADHLLDRGLRHLAAFGWTEAWYVNQRLLGFSERAAEGGVECKFLFRNPRAEAGKNWRQRMGGVARWLGALPRPCGVFAVHDWWARLLMDACQEAELRIPDDLAIIGMDNDPNYCEYSLPTLSSVARNSERVGWEAAALLDRMMQGEPPPAKDLFVEPGGIVPRQSTDMFYCPDPLVKSALDYMRDNLGAQFNISEIAGRAGVSKRTLELHFRESLGSSPHESFTKFRVQYAQALMRVPQRRKIAQIAAECGFRTTQTFYAAFQRVTGETALSFRKRHAALDPE